MEILFLAIKAIFCGIAVAAPVGPMAVLCIRRTIAQGLKCGLVTALGVAMSDTIYALFAVLGIKQIYNFVQINHYNIESVVGVFIMIFGINIYFKKTVNKPIASELKTCVISAPYSLFSAMFLTLANPVPLLFFVSIFTILAPEAGFTKINSIITVIGVFTGSLLWFLGIVASVYTFRHNINSKRKLLIDHITGILLMILGLAEFLHLL